MGFACGIVGLPNVGKSTIFNALTAAGAEAANYPFCTIEPNVGVVPVPDVRLEQLAKLSKSQKIIPTSVKFVDIAGLVQGASQGEGLGNQFLGHIRSVDAIVHVVRCFEDENVVHVNGKVSPKEDAEVINTELLLADLQSVDSRIEKARKAARGSDKEAKQLLELLEMAKSCLEKGHAIRTLEVEEINALEFITNKPILYLANVSEDDVNHDMQSGPIAMLKEVAEADKAELCLLSGKVESELSSLDPEERELFLADLGLEMSGLERLAQRGYNLLNLITFFTSGEQETRAWTCKQNTLAPQAAGKIHTDFERGFIRAEVIAFDDFISSGGELAAKEKGLLRVEGKDYVVHDGDVVHFRFNV